MGHCPFASTRGVGLGKGEEMTEPMSDKRWQQLQEMAEKDVHMDYREAVVEIHRLRADVERLKENTKYDLAWINKAKAKFATGGEMTDETNEELRDLRILCRSQEITIHRLKEKIKMKKGIFKTVLYILEKELEEK